MRKHRFFLSEELAVNQTLILDTDISHQINRVLRLQKSAEIYLFNNSGSEYTAIILEIARNAVTVIINNVNDASLESPLKINLAQVISKGEKMDLVIQKATELGVHSITPIYSEHSIMKQATERISSKLEHWQRVANAACCQCWRNIVPVVHPAQDLSSWVAANTDPVKLILSPGASSLQLRAIKAATTISILIGPEGGFSDSEIKYAVQNNFSLVSLGPRILRTETAGLAAIAVLQAMYGDM